MVSCLPVFVRRVMGKGKREKRPHKCVLGFILWVKRSLAVIKGQLNWGEVKGDWLVSGEGALAGVTQALQEPQCRAALAGSGKGGAGRRVPLSVAAGREAQSLTPTQPFPALEKKSVSPFANQQLLPRNSSAVSSD